MSAPDAPRPPEVDGVAVVTGVLSLGLAVAALVEVDLDTALVAPSLLLVAGAAGLVAAARRGRD